MQEAQDRKKMEKDRARRQELEDERKKHREMKQMFDDTINNMESANRQVSTKELEIKATRAVDEIFGKDSAVSLEELRSENAKQKSVIAELK